MKFRRVYLIACWLLTSSLGLGQTTVPELINYQARLTDAAGQPLSNGTYQVRFELFATVSGGTAVWGATYNVSVVGGQFSILLGGPGLNQVGTISAAFTSAERLLQMTVQSGPGISTPHTLLPRQQITSVPYALKARGLADGTRQIKLSGPDPVLYLGESAISTFPGGTLYLDPGNGRVAVDGAIQIVEPGGEITLDHDGTHARLELKSKGEEPYIDFAFDPSVDRHGRIMLIDAWKLRVENEIVFGSDERLKKEVSLIDSPLERLAEIRGVRFKWNDQTGASKPRGVQIGVIAQDVAKVMPEAVTADKEGLLNVNYQALIPLLIEAVKQQQKEIHQLREMLQSK